MQDKIVQFLKNAQGYVSGEEISNQLNISRAAIWKHMQDLRSKGYDIQAVPHLGYQLIANPDILSTHEIQYQLRTKIMGQQVHAFDSLPSTMDEAFNLGMQGALEGTLVTAEAQTKGRGRLGRVWVSPKSKGIYCSIILRPKLSPTQMPQLTLMTAVAISQAIKQVINIQVKIKWPNDLMVESKKIAGILTETRAETDQINFVVVGFGINVNAQASQILDTASSLKMITEQPVDRVQLLQEILYSLEKWYTKVLKGNFVEVIKYAKLHSATLKHKVRIQEGKGIVEGVAVDIDHDGGLFIRLENGKTIKKIAGEVLVMKK